MYNTHHFGSEFDESDARGTLGRACLRVILRIKGNAPSVALLSLLETDLQGAQLKSGPYFNTSNLFTKIYNTTNLYLQ